MNFLRHEWVLKKSKRIVLKQPFSSDFFVTQSNLSLTGCSIAEPVSVSFDVAKRHKLKKKDNQIEIKSDKFVHLKKVTVCQQQFCPLHRNFELSEIFSGICLKNENILLNFVFG